MQPIEFIEYYYYSTAYYIVLVILTWATCIYYVGSNGQKVLHAESSPSQGAAVMLTIIVSIFCGLRQLARDFGDTIGYSRHYYNSDSYMTPDLSSEWLWQNFQMFCKHTLHFNVHEFFLLVAFIYFGGMLICCMILTRKNMWMGMIFFLTAFDTFSYGVNGIRNGAACSLELVAIALLCNEKPKPKISMILMWIALVFHRSTALPSAAALFSYYYCRDTKLVLKFWVASIAISLVAGNAVTAFFAALGFDDRLSTYHQGQFREGNEAIFSSVGFRWDFLLYSSFPVALIWYLVKFRNFTDRRFAVLANTYLFCNAFWIMVIRASFSNRFAYLSWFLHPLVMFYPLFRLNIWKDQDRKTALILFGYAGFTFFMFFIYYFGTTGFRGFDQYWWR